MYYPLQVPSLLDKEFIKQVEYKENQFRELQPYIMCVWSMQSFRHLDKPVNNIILPDGCIDLIVDFSKKEIQFAASSKVTWNYPLENTVDFLGVRIKPGIFYNMYKYDCSKVMDKIVPFNVIETNYDLSLIFSLTRETERITFIRNYVSSQVKESMVDHFVFTLNNTEMISDAKYVDEIAKALGYSVRQTNRMFKQRCGVSVKTFLNINRLHEALYILIYEKRNTLTQIATQSGFYDESHFIKEIEKYCGISPTELVNRYKKMA